MERRLVAIMATDVVGYSRLIRADEEGTLLALRTLREELIDPKIKEHRGRIVKLMGDGMLVEFASVVDAVACSAEMQQALAVRSSGEPSIVFRVGVNLGDVVIDGDDIQGDGVNVASRLEALSDPGGMCISDAVHEQVRDRLDLKFEDFGKQEVKNIDRPVQAWKWSASDVESASESSADGTSMHLADKPSIAVLPFDNMSSDPEQDFFADGITEDIITALSKISRMRVIARNSAFAYKGQARDLRHVAEELGVRYILEGSVRSGGSRLRITAQLIDANDGSHIWAERYDRMVDDIFDIQDEITKEIVTALRVKLTDGENAAILARGTNDIEAWQLCVRAAELFIRFNSTDYLEARALAEKAVTCDSNYAYAWATLGLTYWWDSRLGFTAESDAKIARAHEYAERAMALDDTLSWVIGLNVHVAVSQGREQDALTIARRGVELNPGNADIRAFLALSLTHTGRYRESIRHFHAAMSLNPFYPNWYRYSLTRNLMILGEFDEALVFLDEVLSVEPANLGSWVCKAYMFGEIGRTGDAEAAIREVGQLAPNLRLTHVPGFLVIKEATAAQRIVDGLRKVGFPE